LQVIKEKLIVCESIHSPLVNEKTAHTESEPLFGKTHETKKVAPTKKKVKVPNEEIPNSKKLTIKKTRTNVKKIPETVQEIHVQKKRECKPKIHTKDV
jgi:hypothetical protein